MGIEDAKKINNIGKDPNYDKKENNQDSFNITKGNLFNWLLSIFLSLLPLLALPIYKFAINISTDWLKVLASAEIIFVGVMATITVVNDFFEKRKKYDKQMIFLIVWAIIGTIIFSVKEIADYNTDGESNPSFWIINVAYCVVVLIIGLLKYLAVIIRNKKEGK